MDSVKGSCCPEGAVVGPPPLVVGVGEVDRAAAAAAAAAVSEAAAAAAAANWRELWLPKTTPCFSAQS